MLNCVLIQLLVILVIYFKVMCDIRFLEV